MITVCGRHSAVHGSARRRSAALSNARRRSVPRLSFTRRTVSRSSISRKRYCVSRFWIRAAKCASRARSYSFSEFQASRKEANSRNGNVYYLPDHYPSDTGNFGIAHIGPLQHERKGERAAEDATLQLLPVRALGFNKLASR